MCAHVCKGMFSRTSDVRIKRVVERCLWCVDEVGIRGARWAKLPGGLSWVKAGEWLSYTHSVEHVGDWGRCVKCCLCVKCYLCVLKRFLNTYILLTWKKTYRPPTCCTWNNGKLVQLDASEYIRPCCLGNNGGYKGQAGSGSGLFSETVFGRLLSRVRYLPQTS